MVVTVTRPARLAAGGTLTVADFTDIPGCLAVYWDTTGDLAVEFNRDLTTAEQAAVTRRANSVNANEETLRAQAGAALETNRDFLAVAAPTNAQVVAQVRAMSRQLNAVIRLALHELDDVS